MTVAGWEADSTAVRRRSRSARPKGVDQGTGHPPGERQVAIVDFVISEHDDHCIILGQARGPTTCSQQLSAMPKA